MKLFKKIKEENKKIYKFKNFEITFFKTPKIDYTKPTQNFGIETKDKDLVILANGPSLKEDIKNEKFHLFIKDKAIFVVNFFPLTEQFKT